MWSFALEWINRHVGIRLQRANWWIHLSILFVSSSWIHRLCSYRPLNRNSLYRYHNSVRKWYSQSLPLASKHLQIQYILKQKRVCYLILFEEDGCCVKNINGFFEGRLSQTGETGYTIYTVTVDGCETASDGHPLCQNGKMTIVDVNIVRFNDISNLIDDRLPSCLDTQNCNDFLNVVCISTCCINLVDLQNFFQIGSTCVEDNLLLFALWSIFFYFKLLPALYS